MTRSLGPLPISAEHSLIHCNVTSHPSAAWTLQQLREAVGLEGRYEHLLHDRDSIFAKHLDEPIERLGRKVLKSPPCSPMANAVCERAIGPSVAGASIGDLPV